MSRVSFLKANPNISIYNDSKSLPRVLLERKPQHSNLLPYDGIEHGGHDPTHKAALLVVVDLNHLFPVVCHFWQAIALTNVDYVENVLLEARAAEANAGVQELGPDA